MGEQSHLEAMREAIRGDRERARERRPSIFERPAPPPVEIRAAPVKAVEAAPVAEPEPDPEIAAEPVAAEPEPEPAAEEPAVEPEPAPSIWSRLAFWRR